MVETRLAAPAPPFSKARILAFSLADFIADLVLPTAIYLLLARSGLSAAVRLTIGGFFVAAKACAGRVSSPNAAAPTTEVPANFARTLAIGVVIAAVCTMVTVAVHLAGRSDTLAIVAGTGVLVVVQGLNLLRARRRLDGFALLVLVELTMSIVLTSVGNSARFVLIRPSFYTAIAGVYVLTTVWSERPFMMQVSEPMATRGDPVRAEAFERAGRESLPFRRAEQATTFGLAIVLLAESVLRVVTVLSLPAADVLSASLWSQAPAIGLFLGYFAIVKIFFVPRTRREVDALMPGRQARP